tara:strand:- start:2351 stop:2632 length:282 start_codon:yes stop_codon:yes gene_type:complete
MAFQDILDKLRSSEFIVPRVGLVNVPYSVGRSYRVVLEIAQTPRTIEVPSARPGRAPNTATLVSGPAGEVRIGADRVYFDAEADGTAVVEVTY